MDKVDIREFPRTGDQQAVITKDNVSLQVSATIFCQVTDVKLGPLRGQRLRPGHRPDGPDRPAGRLRRAHPRRVAVRARDHQHQDAGPHGRGHPQVGRAAQPHRDPRHHPADQRPPGDVGAEGGRAAQAGRHLEVGGGAAGRHQQRPGPQAGRRARGRGRRSRPPSWPPRPRSRCSSSGPTARSGPPAARAKARRPPSPPSTRPRSSPTRWR